jgi:hypothetical protein
MKETASLTITPINETVKVRSLFFRHHAKIKHSGVTYYAVSDSNTRRKQVASYSGCIYPRQSTSGTCKTG